MQGEAACWPSSPSPPGCSSACRWALSFWHDHARRARDRGYTHREILARMRSGADPTTITTDQTIGQWIRGDSEGPDDPDDVRCFAEAVRDRELADRADSVGQALRTRRIVHRAVGRWLSAQITGAQLRRDDALIDPELGVHVADLLDAVSLHEVADVGTRLVRVPAVAVGSCWARRPRRPPHPGPMTLPPGWSLSPYGASYEPSRAAAMRVRVCVVPCAHQPSGVRGGNSGPPIRLRARLTI